MAEGAGDKMSMEDLIKGVFADLVSIVTEDIVLEAHRTEKVTNMGFFSQDGVLVTTQELQTKRNEEPEHLSAIVMGRSLRIPIDDNICQKCQHPIQQNLDTSLTAPARKYCPRPPYRDHTGQDMYGKSIQSSSIQVPKVTSKQKFTIETLPSTRQTTPIIREETGKLPPVKDPQGNRLSCPACNQETSFKLWISKHKSCLGFTDRKVPSHNGDSGSGTPHSPDSPNSSFAEGENAPPPKKKKVQSDPKPPTKKAQPKRESSNAGEPVPKGSITSAPRLEKSLSTASARPESPAPSAPSTGANAASSGAGPKKKKPLLKRKAENIEDDVEKKPVDPYDIDYHPTTAKEKDTASTTPTKPNKKQKTSNTPTQSMENVRVSPHPGTPTTKNLVSKFKDRAGSPTPTKKERLGNNDTKTHSDNSGAARKASPKLSGDKDSKLKKSSSSKPDGSPKMKKLAPGSMVKSSKKESSNKGLPHKKKERRQTPDRT
ncbi:hypothetical protein TWF569_000679 [Orbilia oligospora]|uniref:SAGA-associated factor 11 n=1 Tax=Orbilia oligospora TaxID=2813651 RepID=A0A7C8NJ42_ORBOL|nr:hypothetical protein TWF102_003543 [Orbilia oligospora]KAF3082790.1 hypothetical protein TWF103_003100 [Orbilia oligospora]KAF3088681.1 hypothetical protein TWF706_010685 [Orbilia oligospora]KAF3121536.1 hypothetical protein TWF594_003170 [Orbilia oligospora]KAF3124947.1 hypothetical protein TWF703_011155 [Orbilia oligospora]